MQYDFFLNIKFNFLKHKFKTKPKWSTVLEVRSEGTAGMLAVLHRRLTCDQAGGCMPQIYVLFCIQAVVSVVKRTELYTIPHMEFFSLSFPLNTLKSAFHS